MKQNDRSSKPVDAPETEKRPPVAGQHDTIRPRLVCLGLALITLLIYLPVYQHRFLDYDDPLYITENKQVQAGLSWKSIQWAFQDVHASMWHPVTWLSHMTDCQLFDGDPAAHHLMNALWHVANAALLFLILFRLTRAIWPSAFAVALFALHPLRVESVAWAAERKDVLSTFFFLLMVLAYLKFVRDSSAETETEPLRLKGAQPNRRAAQARRHEPQPDQSGGKCGDYVLALLCLTLGLMCKAMLVTAPFVLLLLDVWPLRRLQWDSLRNASSGLGRVLLEKVPFFLLAAGVCVVTMLAQRPETMVSTAAYPIWMRVFYSVVACGTYLLKTVWPVNLAIIYPLPREIPWLRFGLSAMALIGISYGCWRTRQTRPHLLIGWLWFLGTLTPVIGLVQVGAQFMADRYTYLPHIGLFLALAFEARRWVEHRQTGAAKDSAVSWSDLAQQRKTGRALAGIALIFCAVLTERQLSYWVDGRTLFTHALAVTSDNAFAHLNLAISLEHAGEPERARREYEEALRLGPGLSEAHANLADLLNELGETDSALAHYRESLRLQDEARVHENLGALLAKLGKFEEAMAQYAAAAKLDPADPRPYYLMGKARLRQGQNSLAAGHFQEALHRNANDLQTLVYLARVLAAAMETQVRNGPQAVSLAERANDLAGGTQSFVLDTLAMAYAESGRFAEAVTTQQEAIKRAQEGGEKDALSPLESRLRLYREGKTYREQFAVDHN